jgi:metal-responsive CopG/Arc/MetJ family transcriptional regulator
MRDVKYTEKLVLQVPPTLGEKIDQAAARKMQKRSEWIRAAIAEKLSSEGVSLVAA